MSASNKKKLRKEQNVAALTEKQRMQQKHGNQMACYAEAVKALFGKAPDQRYIYSLPVGRMVGM